MNQGRGNAQSKDKDKDKKSTKIISAADIKAQVNIADVVSSYVALRKQGQNLWGLCPFHSERTPSFSVHPEMQIFKCFGCGKKGDLITFVMEIEHVEFKDAVKKLKEQFHIEGSLPPGSTPMKTYEPPKRTKLPDEQLDQISRELQSSLSLYFQHHDLLKAPERGMSDEQIRIRGYRSFPEKAWEPLSKINRKDFEGFPGAFQVSVDGPGGKKREYWTLNKVGTGILVPIHNERNYLVGWQIRLDKIPNNVSIETDFPNQFQAFISRQEEMIKVLWDGEIIAEIPEANLLPHGESKSFTTMQDGQKVVLGEIRLKKGQKYFWLSSSDKPKGAEAGNPLPVHVAVPTSLREQMKPGQLIRTKKAFLTEGPIKADIAAEYLNEVVIGIPGLSAWRQALECIENMGVTHAVLAFDMDIARKDELRDQIGLFKEKLYELPFIEQADIALWSETHHGKGIDDALLASYQPMIRTLFAKKKLVRENKVL